MRGIQILIILLLITMNISFGQNVIEFEINSPSVTYVDSLILIQPDTLIFNTTFVDSVDSIGQVLKVL